MREEGRAAVIATCGELMTEPRIRPERFTTQPGEVRLGKLDAAGRWRPLTAAEAREDGITDYDPATGKVGTAPDADD